MKDAFEQKMGEDLGRFILRQLLVLSQLPTEFMQLALHKLLDVTAWRLHDEAVL